MKWIAEFKAYDEKNGKVTRLGIKQDRHLIGIYFDFDTNDPNFVAVSEEEAIEKIEKHWNYMKTYRRID